jgi:hypothetical protein
MKRETDLLLPILSVDCPRCRVRSAVVFLDHVPTVPEQARLEKARREHKAQRATAVVVGSVQNFEPVFTCVCGAELELDHVPPWFEAPQN